MHTACIYINLTFDAAKMHRSYAHLKKGSPIIYLIWPSKKSFLFWWGWGEIRTDLNRYDDLDNIGLQNLSAT